MTFLMVSKNFTDHFFWEKNSNHSQTHIQKFEILHFLDKISKIIIIQNFSMFKTVCHINLKEQLHYGIIVKFQGCQIFVCVFGEWFLFLSQKKSSVNVYFEWSLSFNLNWFVARFSMPWWLENMQGSARDWCGRTVQSLKSNILRPV